MIGIMALVMGLFTAVQSFILPPFFPETTPLTFAPLWVLFEWLQNLGFHRLPMAVCRLCLDRRLLDGYAPLFGIFGVSFVVLVLACALVEVLNRRVFRVIPSALLGTWGMGLIKN